MKPVFKVGDIVTVCLPPKETLVYDENSNSFKDTRIDGCYNEIIPYMYENFNNKKMKIKSIEYMAGIDELIYLEHGVHDTHYYWRAEWLISDNSSFYGELWKLIQQK